MANDPLTGLNKSAPEILARIISNYESLSGRTLAPGDPLRFVFAAFASPLAQAHSLIDFNAKSNLLGQAKGEYLDEIAAMHGVTRLSASKATCIQRFSLAASRVGAVPIPQGTRVTTLAGTPSFATTAYAEVAEGQTYVDVTVECSEAGTVGNGYTAGQLSVLSDPIAYVVSTTNTETTTGGDDAEKDDPFRARVIASLDSLSTAGPGQAYVALAKSANPAIIDVSVLSPEPGVVNIYPLLKNGDIPGQSVLTQVEEICSEDTARPLTDQVHAVAPTPVEYSIEAQYWLSTATVAAGLEAAQARVQAAAESYRDWQQGKIGRDIMNLQLRSVLYEAGVVMMSGVSPSDAVIPLEPYQVAKCTGITLVYVGTYDGGE
jgi:phage-related baseplate assembly protein